MKFIEISESFNTIAKREIIKATADGSTIRSTIGNRVIVYMSHITTDMEDNRIATIEFYEKDLAGTKSTYDKTGSGSAMQVFAFIKECVEDTIIDYKPDMIDFSAVKSEANRSGLYKKLMSKIPVYRLVDIEDGRYEEHFVYVRDK
jgi:hypothetical protein